jgi:hypothetical protein
MAGPRETSLCNLGFRRAKGIMDQSDKFPLQITAKDEIVKKNVFHWMAPVCETKQIKLEYVLAVG